MKTTLAWVAILLCTSIGCGDSGSGTQDDAQGPHDAPATAADGNTAGFDAAVPSCVPTNGTDLKLTEILSDVTRPIFAMAPPGDHRLFIGEQGGRIRILEDGSLRPTAFLELNVECCGENGLLGMAFHPNYAQNGKFYVHYSVPEGRPLVAADTIIAEFQVSSDPNVAETTSRTILTVDQPFSNHNAGSIAFGADGMLYIGLGDGGLFGDTLDHAENTKTLLGSILRIDVNGATPYEIPSGNPFENSPNTENDPRPEIWSYGWRNPFRFSFDSMTGDLYVGDVGQEQWEEISIEPAGSAGGLNYGWDIVEGKHCHEPGGNSCDMSGTVLPVVEYDSTNGREAVIGGYAYRGVCMPDIDGWYFYGDHNSAQIWKIEYPGNTTPVELTSDLDSANLITEIYSFGQDGFGELYVLDGNRGRIYRIEVE